MFVDGLKIITDAQSMDQTYATIRVSQVELRWMSFTNKTYQVQYSSSLSTNSWTDLGIPLQGTDATNCVTDVVPPGEPERFYRVVVKP